VLEFYRFTNDLITVLVSIPALFFAVVVYRSLPASLAGRKRQIVAFGLFLGANLLASAATVSSFLSYQQFPYRPFIDLLIFGGLGATLAIDFQITGKRSAVATKMAPKWFAAFLSSGIQKVKLELPLIVLAVDTVAYTKILVTLGPQEKDQFHERLRAALDTLATKFEAQKISERGDGGIFAWDYIADGPEKQRNLALALAAAKFLTQCEIQFRQGMAVGQVRGEMSGSDFSFLGEALIRACRLEPIAEPGTVLVDETLATEYEAELGQEWTEANIKGVLYRARPLQKMA
jgi:class 3 adenylate cyclase